MILTKIMIVSGRVQGVGFRWATLRLAEQLGINGFVRNEANGDVMIHGQGSPKQLTAFIQQVKQGPTPYAKVTHVQVSNQKEKSFQQFTIR